MSFGVRMGPRAERRIPGTVTEMMMIKIGGLHRCVLNI